ncbi:MAG TPA: AsnC family protein [Candidatus Nitrosocosmicus sp.]
MILDKIDLNILPTLAIDCRTSYSNIGSLIGLTSECKGKSQEYG